MWIWSVAKSGKEFKNLKIKQNKNSLSVASETTSLT